MHGDYSRGHEPDRKRGRSYRRVLLQMGRPVLDSDVASMVDALLGEVRATTRGLGCAAGSPDLGFLVTPGRLLAVFAEAQAGLTVTQGTPDAWLDYRFRFAERYPALHLAATGVPRERHVAAPPAARPGWAGARGALGARRDGDDDPRQRDRGQPRTARRTFPRESSSRWIRRRSSPLEIALAAGDEVWLFLLEQDEVAGTEPVFWVAPGSYHVDGLVVDAHGGGSFPSVAFPDVGRLPVEREPAATATAGWAAPDRSRLRRPASRRLPGDVGTPHHGGRGSWHSRGGTGLARTRAPAPSCSVR